MKITQKLSQLTAILFVSLSITACQAPGTVEGIVFENDYSIRDMQPAVRAAGETFHLVLSEEDGERMNIVTLEIPDTSVVAEGETLKLSPVGEDKPTVSVATGDLVVMERGDGARILSTDNTVFSEITTGSVVFTSFSDTIEGAFRAELSDGGFIEGRFLTEAPLQ